MVVRVSLFTGEQPPEESPTAQPGAGDQSVLCRRPGGGSKWKGFALGASESLRVAVWFCVCFLLVFAGGLFDPCFDLFSTHAERS